MYVLLDELLLLRTGVVWLLEKRACSLLEFDALCDTLDLDQITRPHLLVLCQHEEYRFSKRLIFDVRKMYYLSLLQFGCLRLAINKAVLWRND